MICLICVLLNNLLPSFESWSIVIWTWHWPDYHDWNSNSMKRNGQIWRERWNGQKKDKCKNNESTNFNLKEKSIAYWNDTNKQKSNEMNWIGSFCHWKCQPTGISWYRIISKQRTKDVQMIRTNFCLAFDFYCEINSNNRFKYSPMLVSYACKYSDVMNWETSELLPTAVSPNISTLANGKFANKKKCFIFYCFFLQLRSQNVTRLSNPLSNSILKEKSFLFCLFWLSSVYLYGPAPGFEVLLSRLDAKLHVADVRAELPGLVAVKCSVLKCLSRCRNVCVFPKKRKRVFLNCDPDKNILTISIKWQGDIERMDME